jgi:hypothetical protein
MRRLISDSAGSRGWRPAADPMGRIRAMAAVDGSGGGGRLRARLGHIAGAATPKKRAAERSLSAAHDTFVSAGSVTLHRLKAAEGCGVGASPTGTASTSCQ